MGYHTVKLQQQQFQRGNNAHLTHARRCVSLRTETLDLLPMASMTQRKSGPQQSTHASLAQTLEIPKKQLNLENQLVYSPTCEMPHCPATEGFPRVLPLERPFFLTPRTHNSFRLCVTS